jgi:hypothetical protein
MTLSIEIEVARKGAALVVPAGSLRDVGRKPWLLVAKDGRVERREVTTGLAGQGGVEILTGVAEGEQVLGPAPAVAPGARVHPVAPR